MYGAGQHPFIKDIFSFTAVLQGSVRTADRRVHLTVVYFGHEGLQEVKSSLVKLSSEESFSNYSLLPVDEEFSRGRGLDIGAHSWTRGDVLMSSATWKSTSPLDFLNTCRLHASPSSFMYNPRHCLWKLGQPLQLTCSGMNSILVYVGHSLLGFYFPFSWELRHQDGHWGRLFQGLWATSLWVLVAFLLHRKRFFLKI
ncbi:unnamed protein product [Boreogadus saida]